MDKKDNSTLHKHYFGNVAPEYEDLQPSFICPAFTANLGSCKNAK
jgi:hypothetical protein